MSFRAASSARSGATVEIRQNALDSRAGKSLSFDFVVELALRTGSGPRWTTTAAAYCCGGRRDFAVALDAATKISRGVRYLEEAVRTYRPAQYEVCPARATRAHPHAAQRSVFRGPRNSDPVATVRTPRPYRGFGMKLYERIAERQPVPSKFLSRRKLLRNACRAWRQQIYG